MCIRDRVTAVPEPEVEVMAVPDPPEVEATAVSEPEVEVTAAPDPPEVEVTAVPEPEVEAMAESMIGSAAPEVEGAAVPVPEPEVEAMAESIAVTASLGTIASGCIKNSMHIIWTGRPGRTAQRCARRVLLTEGSHLSQNDYGLSKHTEGTHRGLLMGPVLLLLLSTLQK